MRPSRFGDWPLQPLFLDAADEIAETAEQDGRGADRLGQARQDLVFEHLPAQVGCFAAQVAPAEYGHIEQVRDPVRRRRAVILEGVEGRPAG